MNEFAGLHDGGSSWIKPRGEQGIGRYLALLRQRIRLILAVAAVCTLAAAVYVLHEPKQYEAQAQLLVTPAPDTLLPEQSLLRDSSDPTVDVESVSLLVTTNGVAQVARAQLATGDTPAQLLNDIQSTPVAGSSLVAITATATDPVKAQRRANAFANATVQYETQQLHASLANEAKTLQAKIAALPPNEPPAVVSALSQQLTSIEGLGGSQDPTIRVAATAMVPTSVTSPHPLQSIAIALIAGLVLGIGVALAFHGLDPILRHEDQLEARYALPRLARIPSATRRNRPTGLLSLLRRRSSAARGAGGPLVPGRMPAPVLDAYRSLPPVLAAIAQVPMERSGPRSILVTSASEGEGKSTTAICLAWALAAGGHRVILIEADFRQPSIGSALGISSPVGTGTLLDSAAADRFRGARTPGVLEDALARTRLHGVELEILLAGNAPVTGATTLDRLLGAGAGGLIALAGQHADFIVIDSPGLNGGMETLPLARAVDELLLVVSVGQTRMARLDHLGELLLQYDIRPTGFVVVGGDDAASRRAYQAPSPNGRAAASRPRSRV
jgi:Mrp family chromosome partitioning ATPase/capsular polysaccharide biosynthesis protein